MDQKQLATRARKLILASTAEAKDGRLVSSYEVSSLRSRAASLFVNALGPNSTYLENLKATDKLKSAGSRLMGMLGVLVAFSEDAESGYLKNIRHEVEVEVVSEFVEQAKRLVALKKVHPAAALLVVSAGAEEFLRSWCTLLGIKIPVRQRSLSRYAAELRAAGRIKLPEERRIQAWADYRNFAAHGDWKELTSKIANQQIKEIEDFLLSHCEELV